jgi:ABC-2 type transport system permease protein
VVVRGDQTDRAAFDLAHLLARDLAVQSRLRAAGVESSQVPQIISAPPVTVRGLILPSSDSKARKAIVALGAIMLYLGLAAYGGWVTSGVLEEKSSRVAEVILSAVRSRDLLAGKMIGIGLLGLGQFAAVALAGTMAAISVGRHLPSSTPEGIGLIVMWFLLGYAFYCSAFAVAGAASSRQEDAPTVAGPLTLLILLGYFVSLGIQLHPDSLLARIAPFVPPLAPLAMPARMLLGHPQPWELPASVAIVLMATCGLVRLAGRAYSGNVLRFDRRVTLREVLRP